jgi:general transcription factor 3C polypeptide 6
MSTAKECLFPGYTQVDSFGPDDEYELDQEEVSYVTLDLGSVEPTLVPSSSSYRLIVRQIGLEGPGYGQ